MHLALQAAYSPSITLSIIKDIRTKYKKFVVKDEADLEALHEDGILSVAWDTLDILMYVLEEALSSAHQHCNNGIAGPCPECADAGVCEWCTDRNVLIETSTGSLACVFALPDNILHPDPPRPLSSIDEKAGLWHSAYDHFIPVTRAQLEYGQRPPRIQRMYDGTPKMGNVQWWVMLLLPVL